MLRYLDLMLILIAAPIVVLTGAPLVGYGIGALTWILLRLLRRAVDQHARAVSDLSQLVALRLGYRFLRVAILVVAVVLTDKWGGKHDALTAVLVIAVSFTVELSLSVVDHVGPLPRVRPARSGDGEP
jgi:L-lactate permease